MILIIPRELYFGVQVLTKLIGNLFLIWYFRTCKLCKLSEYCSIVNVFSLNHKITTRAIFIIHGIHSNSKLFDKQT